MTWTQNNVQAERPMLVHMSPLPDMRNGIADYAAEILVGLSRHYQCLCVVESPSTVSNRIRAIGHVMSYEDYARLAPDLAGQRHLAHLGNNPDHLPILSAMGRVPSVVVVHDLTMHYLMECWARQTSGTLHTAVQIFRSLHGPIAAELAARRYDSKIPANTLFTEVDSLPLLNGWAAGAITHSHLGHVRLRAAGFDGPVRVIPHFATELHPANGAKRHNRIREALNVGPEVTLMASLGFVTPNKQIEAVLETLAELPAELPQWHYIIAGENRTPTVRETCRKLKLEGRVTFVDYVPETEFAAILDAADLCINLRYPTSGETSGTVSRALAHGVPVLIHNHGWYSELPETATYRVPASHGPSSALTVQLIRALCDADERKAKGDAARDYARRHLSLELATAAYHDLIETVWQGFPKTGVVPVRPTMPSLIAFRGPVVDMPAEAKLPAVLRHLLKAEQAVVEDTPLPSVRLDMSSPWPLDGQELSARADWPDSPVQAFGVIEDDGFIGTLWQALSSAGRMLRLNDVLSLAVVSNRPPVNSAIRPGLPDDPGTWSEEQRLRRTMEMAGYSILQQRSIALNVADTPTPYRHITTLSAIRQSDPAAREAGFRQLPGLSRTE